MKGCLLAKVYIGVVTDCYKLPQVLRVTVSKGLSDENKNELITDEPVIGSLVWYC